MKRLKKKLTIIKYGSNTLVTKDDKGNIIIDINNLTNHGLLINEINNPVIIISSGAVAFGKSLGNSFDYIENDIIRKRIFAALGNPHLSISWDNVIKNKQVLQSLITHQNLNSADSKEKILEIIYALFSYKNGDETIIQVNDNDFITDEALIEIRKGEFGDNDQTTALLAILCSPIFEEIEVIINTTSDGVLENKKLLPSINHKELSDNYINQICDIDNTQFGTGGMNNKLKIIREMMKITTNIKAYIIDGKKPENLKGIIYGKQMGTTIY